jgi:acetoin utilization protein AcuB
MRAFEVMTGDVRTVAPETPAEEAWELMRRERIRHLVVMRGKTVAGLLSERDAGGRAGTGVRKGRTVADLMTPRVVTVSPTDTVRVVANAMRGRTIGCVPVLKDRRLVGIVTVSDLLDLIGRGVARPAQPERRGLSHRVPHRKRQTARAAW